MSDKDEQRRQALAAAEIDTLAIRTGHVRTAEGEHSEPIFATSSYVFGSAAEAAARFSGEQQGNVYSRYTNPTVRAFEQRIAALEGAEMAVATSSGMAAILSTCMALLSAGDHIVCSRAVFGSTTVLLNKYMQRFGITTTFVECTDIAQWQQALTANTRLLFWRLRLTPSRRSPISARWRGGAGSRRLPGGRQLFLYARAAKAARFWCRYYHPFGHQISRRAGPLYGWRSIGPATVDGGGVRFRARRRPDHGTV